MTRSLVDRLLKSDEPSIRWRVRVRVLGEDPDKPSNRKLRNEIRRCGAARLLIDGHAQAGRKTYSKWQGGHWVLMALADLAYPPGDPSLAGLRDGVLRTWLGGHYFREYSVSSSSGARSSGIPVINGRYRQCGSLQGGALLAVSRLGLDDGRCAALAERLLHWQWPDGGWNCDRTPDASSSSVYETLIPMRGLAAYASSGAGAAADAAHASAGAAGGASAAAANAGAAARRAAEVLLTRRMVYGRSDGRLIRRDWARLHYPVYWHYDVLAALKGIAEAGLISDPRCADGLDLLQSKELPTGGWAAEAKFYRSPGEERGIAEHVDWGGVDRTGRNDWVTVDALTVLAAAGRL